MASSGKDARKSERKRILMELASLTTPLTNPNKHILEQKRGAQKRPAKIESTLRHLTNDSASHSDEHEKRGSDRRENVSSCKQQQKNAREREANFRGQTADSGAKSFLLMFTCDVLSSSRLWRLFLLITKFTLNLTHRAATRSSPMTFARLLFMFDGILKQFISISLPSRAYFSKKFPAIVSLR